MEKNLRPKLDREILEQLSTEQLVEILIEEGKSIENLTTNRVVELEKEIEKLKVSRDLDSIRLWKAPSGNILKNREQTTRETRRKPDTKTETRRTSRPWGKNEKIDVRSWDRKCVDGVVRGNCLANQ
jgi:transposase